MHGVFDEREMESARTTHEPELTLGSGTLLAIFFGLVLLCGLCFGIGYAVGHRASGPSSITAPRPAPEQEPLQGNGSIPKPSAIAQTPVTPASDASAADQSGQVSAGASQAQVHLTLTPGNVPQSPSTSAQAVRPAMPGAQSQLMVQVASVSNPEDADVLVGALRKRNYPVTARRDPADNFIHVRIGPFASRTVAEQWRKKLLDDGYNAIIQP